MTRPPLLAGTALLLLQSTMLVAAPVPDAGSLMQQQTQQRQELPERLDLREKETANPSQRDEVRFLLKEVRFRGAEGLVAEQELQRITAGWIGHEVSRAGLRSLTERITGYLNTKGFLLSRAVLPEQEVSTGVVTIAIVPAKSDGQLAYHRQGRVRLRQRYLDTIGQHAVVAGGVLRSGQLERSLLLISSQPGLSAHGRLEAGATPGTSKVNIDLSEGPLFTGGITADNLGNRYTGSFRTIASVACNDPFGYGDQLSAMWSQSAHAHQGQANYSVPVGTDGLRAAFGFSGMSYRLAEQLSSYDFAGNSSVIDAGLSYPISLHQSGSLQVQVKYRYRDFEDRQHAVTISNGHSGTLNTTLSGDSYDTMFGQPAYNVWNIGITAGSLKRTNITAGYSSDAAQNGSYGRLNAGCTRVQRIDGNTLVNIACYGQAASTNLDSSEKFLLGGPYGIRAYPIGEAAGDQGLLANAELRYQVRNGLDLLGFYDYGYIELQKSQNQSPGTATNRNTYWLQGAGLGLNYNAGRHFSIRAVWAHTLGDNPGRTSSSNNSDGTADHSRSWLTATLYF